MTNFTVKTAVYRAIPIRAQNFWYETRARENLNAWRNAPFFLVHIPKCAGTSIVKSLGLTDSGHLLLHRQSADLLEALKTKPTLAVLRDPVARLKSSFTYLHRNRRIGRASYYSHLTRYTDINDFVSFIARKNPKEMYFFRPGSDYIRSACRVVGDVDVVDMQQLDEGLSEFFSKHNLPFEGLPVFNASKDVEDINCTLSASSLSTIKHHYAEDFDVLSSLSGQAMKPVNLAR